MNKKIAILILSAFLCTLCGCNPKNISEPGNSAEASETVSITYDRTETIDSIGADIITGQEKLIDKSDTEKADFTENKFINAIENLPDFSSGMLYDFDFDNIPEVVIFDYGMDSMFYNVFKYNDGELIYLGEIRASDDLPGYQYLDLYHSDNEYFYCANTIDFVKNNSLDTSIYGYYLGNLYKYIFLSNGIESSVLLDFMEDSDYKEALDSYIQECNDYLSQFKKVTSVTFEKLWNDDNIRDGTYKDIIFNELKKLTSETSIITETTEAKDAIEILKCSNRGYGYSDIMQENMEFTVDLKEITPETDLFALTNMKKYSLGDEPLKIDLDGDVTEEEFSLIEKELENDWRYLFIVINGTEYAIDINYEQYNVPNEIFFCDIDSSDNYTEIACRRSVMTNDYYTSFYRYESGELRYIFDINYDTPDGNYESDMFFDNMNTSVTEKPIITDGSGVITAARRLDSQTWLAYSHYIYDSESGSISLVCEPVYPYYYENIDSFAAAEEFSSEYYAMTDLPMSELTKEINIYQEPDTDSETLTLTSQRIYFTAEYPYPIEYDPQSIGKRFGLWIHIIAEDGTIGWVNLPNGRNLEESNGEVYYDVFQGLVFYD